MEKPVIAITLGEHAGIGPDLAIACHTQIINDCHPVYIGCKETLLERAQSLGINLPMKDYTKSPDISPGMNVINIPVKEKVVAGLLNKANSSQVLEILDRAIQGCQENVFQAMVTCPIQKSIINEAGISFSGHTEYLAKKTESDSVVMMLATEDLRVALATTHIPLREVADSITEALLTRVLEILDNDLKNHFGITNPRILVAGLNPHAGESGHLGREEIDIISPCIEKLVKRDIKITGPLPADTLFTEKHLSQADAVLAMYHDQGLPVLKHHGFGRAANITLGLPIVRTSVDHGTALDLAGTGNIDTGSYLTAVRIAMEMTRGING